jgi:cytochrome oxidase assembly protein ShyY1
MIRRLPFIPTIIVAAAVAVMIWLGLWQLQRAKWKAGLLARFEQAEKGPPITWPTVPLRKNQLPLFRHATGMCLQPVGRRAVGGESAAGEPGFVHIVDCRTGTEGPLMSVEVGWSKDPNAKTSWTGGPVSGIIAPDRRTGMRLVAATPAPGLQASAVPQASSISPITPQGHRFYALTWFALAVVALVIYGLAVRKRLKQQAAAP